MINLAFHGNKIRYELDNLKEQRLKAEKAFEDFKQCLANGPTKWEKHYAEHIAIILDPDFRRAADKVKIMYNLVKAMHDAPTEVIYTSSPYMDESEMGPSDFHVKESDGDPFYNKYH